MNEICLLDITVNENKVTYSFEIKGEWEHFFIEREKLEVEYSENISKNPKSVLAIPFLGSVLPLAWTQNATVCLDELDKDFYECIPELKAGYKSMIPLLDLKADIIVKSIVENKQENTGNTLVMFSGGVDAFTTLFRHIEENPCLFTIWGADMKLKDEDGWNNVFSLTKQTAEDYHLTSAYCRSMFREFLNEHELNNITKPVIHDNFWHALQHGIALLSQAAPFVYTKKINKVYIASSFPIDMIEKGQVICASDPRTDNCVKYCGCQVKHDGEEYNRQGKIHYLVNEAKRNEKNIHLRVCFLDSMGVNCCRCEKCYRTILQLVVEGADPNQYGFVWNDKSIRQCRNDMKYSLTIKKSTLMQNYLVIQQRMKDNAANIPDHEKYSWILDMDFSKFNDYPAKKFRRTVIYRGFRKIYRIFKK